MKAALCFMTGPKHQTIKLTAKTFNRYVDIHRYGQDFQIKLYRSGDFDVTLKEFCHADVTIRLVSYEEAAPDPDAALQRFEKDISILLEDFLVHYCWWHELMDFMDWHTQEDGSLDWRAAEQAFRSELLDTMNADPAEDE